MSEQGVGRWSTPEERAQVRAEYRIIGATKVVWTDPDSQQELTYATFPKQTPKHVKEEILASCVKGIKIVHGAAAAVSARLSK